MSIYSLSSFVKKKKLGKLLMFQTAHKSIRSGSGTYLFFVITECISACYKKININREIDTEEKIRKEKRKNGSAIL